MSNPEIEKQLEKELRSIVEPYSQSNSHGRPRIERPEGAEYFVLSYELPLNLTRNIHLEPKSGIVRFVDETGPEYVSAEEALRRTNEKINRLPEERKRQVTREFMKAYDTNLLPMFLRSSVYNEAATHTEEELRLIRRARATYKITDRFRNIKDSN